MRKYHVRDPEGNLCRWDAQSKKFISLGKPELAMLTDAERKAATFETSMNGAISMIPAGYDVCSEPFLTCDPGGVHRAQSLAGKKSQAFAGIELGHLLFILPATFAHIVFIEHIQRRAVLTRQIHGVMAADDQMPLGINGQMIG